MDTILSPDSPLVAALHPSPNIGERRGYTRPYLIILHYTGLESVEHSIEVLADPRCKVSCHYVIAEDGRITQMVAESVRAWHAGVSSWKGETDINSTSIGIEIQNPGHSRGYPDFPPSQMQAVRDLCLDIISRHGMLPEHVLAHSDIAPMRKADPGEKFDWAWLAASGVGHWVEPEPLAPDPAPLEQGVTGAAVQRMQIDLSAYGYDIAPTGCFADPDLFVVRAFQRHFRPALVDGKFDRSCAVTLARLQAALPSPLRPAA
ncbi:MAG: N-acetylmuramoyl-L-alanine amidase [Hyphomicrobiaceae bacterium]